MTMFSSRPPRRWIAPGGIGLAIAALLWLAAPAGAHNLPYMLVTIDNGGHGQLEVTVNTYVPAYVLNLPAGLLSPADRRAFAGLPETEMTRAVGAAAARFREEMYFALDGREITTPAPRFPDIELLRRDAVAGPNDPAPSAPIQLTIEIGGAHELTLAAPTRLGQVLVIYQHEGEPAAPQFLGVGETSKPILLGATAGFRETARLFFKQGVLHIVPLGLDHILFIVSLAIISRRLGMLATQISAFTLAHTVTLGLATLQIVPAPAGLVEPLIALSIAAMALDNLRNRAPSNWRLLVVIGFGFLHGFGFAGALREFGLPQGQELTALAAFNIGVEVGQLLVIAGVLLTAGWFMRRAWYHRAVVVPISAVIALTGLFWTLQRLGIAPWT